MVTVGGGKRGHVPVTQRVRTLKRIVPVHQEMRLLPSDALFFFSFHSFRFFFSFCGPRNDTIFFNSSIPLFISRHINPVH